MRFLFLLLLTGVPGVAASRGISIPTFFFPSSQDGSATSYTAETSNFRVRFLIDSVLFQSQDNQIHLRYAGSNSEVRLEGDRPLDAKVNIFRGEKPSRWQKDLPTYGGIVYESLYPGIDLSYRGVASGLKSQFLVHPGADPRQIRIKYEGADRISIDTHGDLVVRAGDAELCEQALEILQKSGERYVRIKGRYSLLDSQTVGFEIGSYDTLEPLIIDPVVSYSTYLGGTAMSAVTGVAVDNSGSLYATGWTEAIDFPIAGAVQSANQGGVDAFVVKMNASGTALVYATYIGGRGDDRAAGIAVDVSGQAYVTGSTESTNFPLVSSFRATLGGGRDAFVLKLSAIGNTLLFSTYLGGTNNDIGTGIAVDGSNNIYVCGDTLSADFPVKNPVQTSIGGSTDAFLAKLTPAGLVFSTFLGGSSDEHAGGIAVDTSGNVYVAGGTYSTNFPVANAFQSSNGGGQDAFLTKINAAGSALTYSTYLGGPPTVSQALEQANAVAVDALGYAYVAGVTNSASFPITPVAPRTSFNAMQDAFAIKVNPGGNALIYGTYLGGSSFNWCSAIALDANGDAFIAGYSDSLDFPLASPVQAGFGGYFDAFVSVLDASGDTFLFSTYYGGSGSDSANAIALDAGGNIYLGGQTSSIDFPLSGAIQSNNLGGATGWLLRMSSVGPQLPTVTSSSPAGGTGVSQTFIFTFSDAAGWPALGVVNVLINNVLDGRHSCYIAYAVQSNSLYLVDDAGDAGGPYAGMQLTGSGTISNSQCIISGAGSSASGSGNTLTLTLNIRFTTVFGGNKVIYLAARDTGSGNSGWQAMGTWGDPWTPPNGPAVGGLSPNRSTSLSQTYAFTFTDTKGWQDIAVANILINSAIDGRQACYVAFVPSGASSGSVFLVDDAGDAGGPYSGMVLPGNGTVQNSQCTISGTGSSVAGSGNTLILTLAVTFNRAFAGNQIFYLAARSNSSNSNWQAVGTISVP